MAEKRQRINVNIYRASHNAEESQYIFDVEEELKKLPKSPGVYIMHSKNDDILYVGKAVSLHSRVRQYFQTGHGHGGSAKIAKMVSQIAYFGSLQSHKNPLPSPSVNDRFPKGFPAILYHSVFPSQKSQS